MNNISFLLTPEEIKTYQAKGTTFGDGLKMDQEEGIFVAWVSNPEKVQKILPPPLKMLAPVATVYINNIDGTNFSTAYREACLIIPVLYNDAPGAYLVSLFVHGPGGAQAAFLGREMAGLPKKFADNISLTRVGDTVKAYVEKDGVRFIDVDMEIGAYNTPDAEQVFAGNKSGAVVGGDSYFIKFDLEQDETGKMNFSNSRINMSTSKTLYHEWLPSSAKVTLQPAANAPWSELEVVQVLGAGYAKYGMYDFVTSELGKLNTEEVMPYLITARYDIDVINKPNRKF